MTEAAGDDFDHVLRDLTSARLQPDDWHQVRRLLTCLDLPEAHPDAESDLTAFLFEARVRGRFAGGRRDAALEPTKQTSVLPWVGLVCGALLVAVGALLGGGVILVGIAGLGLFVFGIAYAGSVVAHRRPAEDVAVEPAVPIPDDLAVAVQDRRSRR